VTEKPTVSDLFDRSEDHEYFRGIETYFIALRGSPLLFSPSDWRTCQRWHRDGVPLALVRRVMDEFFARREEKGYTGKVRQLRQVSPAVEREWERIRTLTAPGERDEAPAFDGAARLERLAAALPDGLPGADDWRARITTLDGDPEWIEERLAAFDDELLTVAATALPAPARVEIEEAVEQTLARLGDMTGEQRQRSRRELTRRLERRKLGLPVLSLFSPEAEG
jgi:hypothetical protein